MSLPEDFTLDGVGQTKDGVTYLTGHGQEQSAEQIIFPRQFALGLLKPETSEAGVPTLTFHLMEIEAPCYDCREVHGMEPIIVGLVPSVARALKSMLEEVWEEWGEMLEEYSPGTLEEQ